MKVKSVIQNFLSHKTECLVVGVFEDKKSDKFIKEIDNSLKGAIGSIIKEEGFGTSFLQTRVLYTFGALSCKRVLLISLGKIKDFSLERIRKSASASAKAVSQLKIKSFSSLLYLQVREIKKDMPEYDVASAITEGTYLSLYEFTCYKTLPGNGKNKTSEFNLLFDSKDLLAQKGIEDALKLSNAVCDARDLTNHPGNKATPTYLALEAKRIAKERGIKCNVLSKDAIEKLGMGGLLGVAKGSKEPPCFIVMEYSGGKKNDKPVVIVGKGLTFDSGGISLKPSEKMEEMKFDMAGGAAAMGTINAAAALKLNVNLVALIPATENMPGGSAGKPGDILKTMSGITVEVINTDAEGRLILADALNYAKRYKPKAVIDLATLTGACVIALGNHASAVLGNDKALIKDLIKAGEKSGERLWEMPLWEEYEEQIKSQIADIKNTGGRAGGTITAAAFLKKFASDYKWAHLDIAGTAWVDKGTHYTPIGGTGVGIRLLVEYLKSL